MNLYMVVISLNSGSVLSKYKSNTTCYLVYAAITKGDYIFASINSPSNLIIFNLKTSVFVIKQLSGMYIYGMEVEVTTGRLVFGGQKGSNGYTTKFDVQYIFAHPDFQTTSSITMSIPPPGEDDIIPESGQTIEAITTKSVSTVSYTNQSVAYVPITTYTSDVNYLIDDLSYSVIEGTISQKIPDLS